MQAETPNFDHKKIEETVGKYQELLHNDKHYQFTQKIQLLSHRKQQSKKYQEAEYLLHVAIEKVLSMHSSEQSQGYQMFDHLFKLYENHPQIWNLEKSKTVFHLLNLRQSDIRFKYYVRLLKIIKRRPVVKQLLVDLVNFYIRNDEFTSAESHVIEMDLSFVLELFKRWSAKLNRDQIPAVQCRLALLRKLFNKNDDSEIILQGVDKQSPFYRFTKFLFETVKLKSREAYDLMGSRYEQFLKVDEIYNKIYKSYGAYYFKIQNKKNSGLMSIFQ